eukprot:TRINITY_DN15715_c0_g1_i1.p1 TRINITY_DN15715_c0_g1~~TRINITY_DN15715_c0_g1_i1.p1  ORF type:complete len:183 (-),score=84.00 TRINITY_DN15715_c0_g1_i1:149-697(-)
MPFRAAHCLMLQKGVGKRKEDDLIKAFSDADKNQDGYLSMDEYVRVFREHGVNITKEEVSIYFSSKDKDRDGLISYQEFCGRKTVTEKAFEALDINSDGYISKPEMIAASQRTGRRLSKTEVEATFKEYDQNKDNKLSYSEFCVMMNKRRTSEKDAEQPEDKRGSRGPHHAARDSSKKYQVD